MPTKKPAKTAKVKLDAKTSFKFEEFLRYGLAVTTNEVMYSEPPKAKAAPNVKLDTDKTAIFYKHLRNSLTGSRGTAPKGKGSTSKTGKSKKR